MNRRAFVLVFLLALVAPWAVDAQAAEWAPNTFYSVNTVVTYQGPSYRCLQAHTSLVGWEPSTTPALWQLTSGTPSPTSTPTPTATPTPGTRPTPTPDTRPTPPPTSFEAEAGTISGATRRSSCASCSGGQKIGFLGNGAANALVMTISASSSGTRSLNIYYLVSGSRTLFYSVNGGTAASVTLTGSSFSTVAPPRAVTVTVNAGSNTVRFFNNTAYAPDLDRVTLTGGPVTPTATPTPSPTPTPTTGPTATPTPRPTPTPAPTPTPCGTGCGGNLPANLITGYWHNFNNGSTTMKLNAIPSKYNLIAVAFADATGVPGAVDFTLDPSTGYTDVNEFKSHIAQINGGSRKVIISVGGQNGFVSVNDGTAATNFANSIVRLMNDYGFAGVDIDLENGLNAQFMGQALRSIANRKPGAVITMAPQTIDMQPGQVNGNGYFRLALNIRDILTVVNMQYYNSGTMLGCDGQVYAQGTINFLTALACVQLQAGLAPSQVGLGVPASGSAAGGGFYSPATVNNAMRCLESRTGCGSFVPPQSWPGIRGAMTWSINWDAVQGYSWVNGISVP